MEDRGEEWEIKKYSSSSEEEYTSTVTWILDKGLSIGKKMVITGVVVSSTPFILPPLFVISAIGIALSVPSGILITSYLCTEKLMSKLLPIKPIKPDHPPMMKEIDEDKEDQDLEEKGDVSAKDEGYEEDVAEYLDIVGTDEEQPSGRVNVTEDASLENKNIEDVKVTESAYVEEKSVEERESGEKLTTEETKEKEAEEVKESEKEKKVDEVAREVAQAADNKTAATEKNDEKDVVVNVVAEKTTVNGNGTNKKSAKKKKGIKKQNGGAAHEEPEKKKEEEKVAAPTTANAEARDTSVLRDSKKVPESKQTAAASTGKEVGLSEEKIWEKLDALKAIVGYNATPHRTYAGELKALYLFTGVDLPTTFKDSSDLVEVNDKLGFLMSIVGVK